MKSHLHVQNHFYPSAKSLRTHFDQRLGRPLESDVSRFVWDYWHVPNQYSLVRTPAEPFFGKLWTPFENSLKEWGEKNLGCRGISPAWLSYYVDGCEQQLHCDSPHGPWAFVFSLTQHHKKSFTGGETLILSPETLSFWSHFNPERGMEVPDLTEKVDPKFNRLVVFDPRLPHGVTPVRGTRDPLFGRIVIHGWFTQPEPILIGPITKREFQTKLESVLSDLEVGLKHLPQIFGTLTLRLKIGPSGKLKDISILTNTIVAKTGSQKESLTVAKWMRELWSGVQFTASKQSREVILPLIFQ